MKFKFILSKDVLVITFPQIFLSRGDLRIIVLQTDVTQIRL